MAKQPKPTATPRAPLSRERVLRTAVDLADQDGIESLSMRRLGRALGVEAMSLYNHVANKDDLLDGLADIVVGEIEPPDSGDDWKTAMRRRAISAREVLARHPWAGGLIESRTTPSGVRLRYAEAVVAALRTAGFSVDMAIHAFTALDSYIYGYAVQERSMPLATSGEFAGVADDVLRALPVEDYPHLREVVLDYVMKPDYDFANEFAFGLDLILDALERLLDTPTTQ